MISRQKLIPSYYSDLTVNIVLLLVQAYGLLFLKWSGLYVIYLFWIDLLFLMIYTVVRNWQFKKEERWVDFRKENRHLFDGDKEVFVFVRVLFLAFYLFTIGVTAIPYEHGFYTNSYNELSYTYREVKSVKDFFVGLLIADPIFLISAFFIMSYYMRQLLREPDTSEKGMIQFSFNLLAKDYRYLCPLIAILSLPAPMLFFLYVEDVYDYQASSYLFIYAIWLLILRLHIDVVLIITLRRELNKAA